MTGNWIDDGSSPYLIRKVKEPFGILGNMSPHDVQWMGIIFSRAEMLFQAMRFAVGSKPWKLLVFEKNPIKAKMIAKAHKDEMIVEPRSADDVSNMITALQWKHDRHADVRQALRQTEQRWIIEDCSNRPTESGLFWGAAWQPDGSWKGQNALGELWMQIRKEHVDA